MTTTSQLAERSQSTSKSSTPAVIALNSAHAKGFQQAKRLDAVVLVKEGAVLTVLASRDARINTNRNCREQSSPAASKPSSHQPSPPSPLLLLHQSDTRVPFLMGLIPQLSDPHQGPHTKSSRILMRKLIIQTTTTTMLIQRPSLRNTPIR